MKPSQRNCSTFSPAPTPTAPALIGRLHQRQDAAWLAELLIDLEEDGPARLRLVAALGRV